MAIFLCRLVFVLIAVSSCVQAGTPYEVAYEYDVQMRTRDGVLLRADVYRPKAAGRFPVILQRSPYDKRLPHYIADGIASAQRGYVYVMQDSRGRFGSEGEWYPFKHDAQDGYDAVEWAAELPYSDGRVAMTGISYDGVTQLLAATAAPPHLVAIYPGITASNYHDHWIYQGGAFAQQFSQQWGGGFAIGDAARQMKASPPASDSRRPPREFPLVNLGAVKDLGQYYYDWVDHPSYDDYWKQWSIEERYGDIKVPALHFGAWYDLFMPGALRNYQGIKERGGSAVARKGQRLVMIPGGHAGMSSKVGELDFGEGASFDFIEYGLRWFDWIIKGIDNGMAKEKPVKLFVMGKNIWREEDDWPLARARDTRYYLHSRGHANTMEGDGWLNTKLAVAAPEDRYVYDPANPVPTHGGAIGGGSGVAGPRDQRVIASRPDVLVYTTPPFKKEMEVTGLVSLELFVSSSAVDTDFTAKLVDVWPSGFAQDLSSGILRMRYRNSMEKAELMQAGEICKVTLELGATSNVFLAGHRLRLQITSSDYPRFDLNPNTGAEPGNSSDFIKATNIIHHSPKYPSALIVPVIP